MTKTYHGSCTCGAIRFECDLDLGAGTTRCNCSFCKKARFWMAFAKGDAFRLLGGREALSDYRRTPASRTEPFLHLYFCTTCGIHPFSMGPASEQLGESFHAVNLTCLDDATDEELATAPVTYADGAHGDWKVTPAEHRYL
ncbi:MAG: GFA family protein [Myxococcota bacterium]|nr:GFA family protein [Myxococcota bacterium]